MWDPQWRTLAGRHRLIRHDMRGFGRSPAPPGAYWIDGPGRRPEDVDPELRRHAHAMQLRALELQVPSHLEVGDLEELLVPDLGERPGEATQPTLVDPGRLPPAEHGTARGFRPAARGLPQPTGLSDRAIASISGSVRSSSRVFCTQ